MDVPARAASRSSSSSRAVAEAAESFPGDAVHTGLDGRDQGCTDSFVARTRVAY